MKPKREDEMTPHAVGTREAWLAVRKELLNRMSDVGSHDPSSRGSRKSG
jgi:hypothetical protein